METWGLLSVPKNFFEKLNPYHSSYEGESGITLISVLEIPPKPNESSHDLLMIKTIQLEG